MNWVDIIFYLLVFAIALIVLYADTRHYVCDDGGCAFYGWVSDGAKTDKDEYRRMLDKSTRYSVWMKAYLVAVIVSFFVFWWLLGTLPPAQHFIVVLLFVFVVYYFSIAFYQHHFHGPVNQRISEYIAHSCDDFEQDHDGDVDRRQ